MEQWSMQGVSAITTRDLSKNPSKALRDVGGHPLVVMRHQRPIACLVSIEQWVELTNRLKDLELARCIAGADRPGVDMSGVGTSGVDTSGVGAHEPAPVHVA
ncbi:type II toxin-antitoxin system Phd/YefM family antitoxin [Burkholderia sp. FERM BP-3421]|jgi:PHD/YefM family antitoxin component YafN of YafNO toxin-antitoxin module|uniref:type II toxin-antitoxin system Phd/YefM family antitoxin n=1 Tax=Burkholderia sp. FERM BP-3421 TaxID=1494466 RepID=UPI00235F4642|nr:type II toxin-antitoxin system Phd/YefM family antitoxin [Burkholderia sp. FERM BP-3421]WDD91347.1 type II toxin-antitoxin system Phd/YefM family antitoxin [Burkholderia sp. FERM BP-3421]